MAQQPSGSPSLFSVANANLAGPVAIPVPTDIPWTQNAASTIALDGATSTLYTLTPGHKYLCQVNLALNGTVPTTATGIFQWVDAANVVVPGSDGGTQILALNDDTELATNKPVTSVLIDRTAAQVDLQVKVRLTDDGGAGNLYTNTGILGTCVIYQYF